MLKDVFVFMFIFLGDFSFNYFCWWKKKLWEHVCLRKKTSNIPSRVFNVKKKCMCTCVRARYLKKKQLLPNWSDFFFNKPHQIFACICCVLFFTTVLSLFMFFISPLFRSSHLTMSTQKRYFLFAKFFLFFL